MAALFASGWPAPASGRYHSLRAAGDGDGGGRATRRGADHRLDREWLWVAPADGAFAFGLVPGDDGAQALRALQAQTPAGDDRPVYAGSVLVGALPAGCLAWSPLSAFTQLRPPLPVHPSAFALAGGLALREEDR